MASVYILGFCYILAILGVQKSPIGTDILCDHSIFLLRTVWTSIVITVTELCSRTYVITVHF